MLLVGVLLMSSTINALYGCLLLVVAAVSKSKYNLIVIVIIDSNSYYLSSLSLY